MAKILSLLRTERQGDQLFYLCLYSVLSLHFQPNFTIFNYPGWLGVRVKKFERRRSLFLATFSLALPLSDRKVPNNNMRSVLQVKGDHLFKDEKPRPEAKKMRNLPIST